mmetsp:Transcript_53821/g.125468  ORF Transcript_53821/g.125468 Transcript_53821/m.125468 type:complete len:92 (-) Transcript_53821:2317-2592(-)
MTSLLLARLRVKPALGGRAPALGGRAADWGREGGREGGLDGNDVTAEKSSTLQSCSRISLASVLSGGSGRPTNIEAIFPARVRGEPSSSLS